MNDTIEPCGQIDCACCRWHRRDKDRWRSAIDGANETCEELRQRFLALRDQFEALKTKTVELEIERNDLRIKLTQAEGLKGATRVRE